MLDNIQIDKDSVNVLEKALSEAIVKVIGTTSGFELNNSLLITGNNPLQESQLVGIMFLTGNTNALLAVTMSNKTASTLVSYISGIETTELSDEDIQDGVSELINMIAGSAKSLLKDTKFYFHLTSPITVVGENRLMIHKGTGNKLYKRFHFGDMQINLIHLIL